MHWTSCGSPDDVDDDTNQQSRESIALIFNDTLITTHCIASGIFFRLPEDKALRRQDTSNRNKHGKPQVDTFHPLS